MFGIVMLFGMAAAAPVAEAKTACSCACTWGDDPAPAATTTDDGPGEAVNNGNQAPAPTSTSPVPVYYQWADLTAGNVDCRADCAVACGGLSEVVEGEYYAVTVDCIPGRASDCTQSGAFSAYQGVNCVEQVPQEGEVVRLPSEVLARTGGRVPHCVVPLTPENANIECRRFGGDAAGGTCMPLPQDISGYHVTRPNLGGQGSAQTFTNRDAVARPRGSDGLFPVSATDGICYRYGVRYGGAPTYEGFDPAGTSGSYTPSSEYVCVTPKRNTCGTVPYSDGNTSAVAQSFSCRQPAEASGELCFPSSRNGELCAGSPGTQCCQGATVFSSCYTDADCSDDRTSLCVAGKCVRNTVCDPRSGQDEYGTLYSERKCRSASPTEKAEEGICSFGAISDLCPGSQACCIPREPGVATGCAADKWVQGLSAYNSFGCVDGNELPLTQFENALDSEGGIQSRGQLRFIGDDSVSSGASFLNRADRENAYTGGGAYHCLGSARPIPGGSVNRCSNPQQYCCNLPQLDLDQRLEAQRRAGDACGTRTGYRCLAVNSVVEGAALEGLTDEEYIRALAGRRVCQITPLQDNYLFASEECTGGTVCCDPNANALPSCQTNADCGGGTSCDPYLGVCLAADTVADFEGDGCFAQASANGFDAGNSTIESRTNAEGDAFRCQFVSDERTGAGTVQSHCIDAVYNACDGMAVPAGLPEGTRAQCCAPNTGFTPSVVSQARVDRGTNVAPFGLQLSPCIQSGNCGLEDILYTGAQFANFLIQISGAIFLAIFVYGGFLYLTAGTSARAAKGKSMIIQASIAMVLILAAFTFVNFVQQSLVGAVVQSDVQASCGGDAQTANFACQYLSSDPSDQSGMSQEISNRGCVRDRCSGPENYLCCPL